MQKLFVFLSLLFVSTSHAIEPDVVKVSSDSVSVQQWILYNTDEQVQKKANETCKVYGKTASRPVGRSCVDSLCVNPVIIFACKEK